ICVPDVPVPMAMFPAPTLPVGWALPLPPAPAPMFTPPAPASTPTPSPPPGGLTVGELTGTDGAEGADGTLGVLGELGTLGVPPPLGTLGVLGVLGVLGTLGADGGFGRLTCGGAGALTCGGVGSERGVGVDGTLGGFGSCASATGVKAHSEVQATAARPAFLRPRSLRAPACVSLTKSLRRQALTDPTVSSAGRNFTERAKSGKGEWDALFDGPDNPVHGSRR